MRVNQSLVLFFLILLSPLHTHAGEMKQTGMSYISSERAQAPVNTPAEEDKSPSAQRVWTKYRSLAAGTYQEETTPTNVSIPGKPEQNMMDRKDALPPPIKGNLMDAMKTSSKNGKNLEPSKTQIVESGKSESQPAASPAGMAGIMQEYRQNKTQRSRLRIITVPQPETQELLQPKKTPEQEAE